MKHPLNNSARLLLATLLFASWCSGCRRKVQEISLPAPAPVQRELDIEFEELPRPNSLEHTYDNGQDAEHYSILESLGGGVALLDFDLDGRLDICCAGGGAFAGKEIVGKPTALFRQMDGTRFADVSDVVKTSQEIYSHGIAAADFNHDGFPDFLVTGYRGLRLFQNQGDGTFLDVSSLLPDTSQWASSAAWGDINNDGRLDLYVAEYVNWSFDNDPFCPGPLEGQQETCPPGVFQGLQDRLFLATEDGNFVDATDRYELRKDGKGLGVVIGDVDLDGDSDIYVANDAVANFLYLNQEGGLQEVATTNGCALGDSGHFDGSMGVDFGDFDGDQLPDIWVANFESETFALYRNLGHAEFQHVSTLFGIASAAALYVGWGTGFCDLDRDTDLDLFVANGHVARHPKNAPVNQKPLLFENGPNSRFRVVTPQADYFHTQHMGRGAAVGDLDEDGDLDLVISHTLAPATVLLNTSRDENHWLNVRLIGTASNREAIGAVVRATTSSSTQVRLRKGGGSYASTPDGRLFFGLADAVQVDLEVTWPSGVVEKIKGVKADQAITIVEGR